jgi:DNA-binding NarL/FixJ family response regulator
MQVRIYLVEDSVMVRNRLAALLWTIPGVQLVGEAESPWDAVMGIRNTHPDVLILDLELDGSSGLQVLREIRAWPDAPSTIVLTNYATPEVRRKCLDIGARYFFDKTNEFGSLKGALAELAEERKLN